MLREARGWWVRLEQALGRGRGQVPWWSGHATLVVPPSRPTFPHAEHIQIDGAVGREVLSRILAKVLEKEAAR